MTTARKVRCPQCGAETPWSPDNPWRPFCSERCKQIDLGCWASNAYVIPAVAQETESGDDFPETQGPH